MEGYSPAVMRKAVRQSSKSSSFKEASDDLLELAELEISATHLQRLSKRIGGEWIEDRDAEIEQYRQGKLERAVEHVPGAAAVVMLDGGRLQTRAEDSGRGVHGESWRESKVAICETQATKACGTDPQPEPPEKFLDPEEASRLATEIKRRSAPSPSRADPPDAKIDGKSDGKSDAKSDAKSQTKKKRRRKKRRNRTRVRTVIATMGNSETFGGQVAAEVHRRGLDLKKRKACVCDGQAYNWSIYEMHLLPLGFIAILDFVHLLAYLHGAAHAWRGSSAAGWNTYEQWLRWAWSGKVGKLICSLRSALAEAQAQGSTASAASTAASLEEALTYVTNNRERMDYPEYRRLGLPISSAPVESTIKQINRRVKGSEKFWLQGGAEAMLQLRAAQLSQDDRWEKKWLRPRKHRRASSPGRLGQAA